MSNFYQFEAFQLPLVFEWTVIRSETATQAQPPSRAEPQSELLSQQTHSVPASPNNTSSSTEMNLDQDTRTMNNDDFSTLPSLSRSSSLPSMNSSDPQANNSSTTSSAASSFSSPLASPNFRPSMTSFVIYIPTDSDSRSFNIFTGSSDSETSQENSTRAESDVHTGFVCNRCDQSPIIGIRYHCQTCVDWDLCSSCYQLEREAESNGTTASEEFLRTAAAPESHHSVSHRYREITAPTPARTRSASASASNVYLPMFFRSLLLSALSGSLGGSMGMDSSHFEQFIAEMMNTQPNGQYGAPPATESAITALRHFKIEKPNLESGTDMNVNNESNSNTHADICAICQEDFVEGDEAMGMPCSHVFHEACLKPWLTQHCTCPNCRTKIANVNDDKLPKETEDMHNTHDGHDHRDNNNETSSNDMDWSISSD